MDKEIRKPTVHSMKRRSHSHDYRRCGYYHITISVAKALRQPLGRIAGRLDKPDGDCDAPHVELSAIGQMVEEELKCSIHQHYPMLEVIEHIVMPEHLHFLLVVHKEIVSQQGRPRHLGNVIAGFKYGCNMRYWTMTGMINPEEAAGKPWSYKFRTHDEGIKVPFCKTMNCVVQALCRTKDNWWKND